MRTKDLVLVLAVFFLLTVAHAASDDGEPGHDTVNVNT